VKRPILTTTAIALGPITGPLFHGFVRCLQARRFVMAGWYAVGAVVMAIALPVVLTGWLRVLEGML
jgi:hypothetical protein